MTSFPTIIQLSSGSPNYYNQRSKRSRKIQIRKEEVKLSLFAGDIILYTENHEDRYCLLLGYQGEKFTAHCVLSFISPRTIFSES